MSKAYRLLEKLLDFALGTFLALMGILILSNVFLRYVFNSGITWAEEVSRILFVWLIFLGAIGALKDNNHLGFTSLVQRMPPTLKKITYIVSNILVVCCLWIMFTGSLEMTVMTRHTLFPATGIPVAYTYGVGILVSSAMLIIILFNLYKAFFVKGAIDELVVLRESEEEISLENAAQEEGKR
jgi:TRAP-type C4-dicarboxylate transport system permease small subunit